MSKLDYISFLPVWVQNVFVSLEGWRIQKTRYDKTFWKILKDMEERLTWDESTILDFRNAMLQRTIRHAYETVPYYQKKFKDLNLTPEDIKTPGDLHKLPIIDRTVLNWHWAEFNSTAIPKRRRRHLRSGGTTGQPLVNVLTSEDVQRWYATWWRYRKRNGIDFNTLCGLWAQTPIVPPTQKKPPYWRMNYPGRELRLSTSHLNHKTYKDYLSELHRRQVPWIHGHPNLVGLLASFMNQDGESISCVRWITTGAENLMDHQKENIRRAFGVEPLQHYGNSEQIANFSQCPKGSLHVDEDFSFVEFVERPGQQNQYTVVGTSLWNLARPLIRYNIGDIVTLSDQRCTCGAWGRIVKSIDGRGDDVIICADNTQVTGFNWVLSTSRNISAAQIYQQKPGEITLRIVKKADFGPKDEQQLLQAFKNRIDEKQLRIQMTYVEEIERTARGKHRMVVSEIQPT